MLLEQLGFVVGDPLDPDAAKRATALENMAAAKRVCAETWKATHGAK